ncbi:hypothetical protein [Komagataeibacter medellinensis]|nr:hypothetical protein [Komagataeibacter medellinensis]
MKGATTFKFHRAATQQIIALAGPGYVNQRRGGIEEPLIGARGS